MFLKILETQKLTLIAVISAVLFVLIYLLMCFDNNIAAFCAFSLSALLGYVLALGIEQASAK